MDLASALDLRITGQPSKTIFLGPERELGLADLLALEEGRGTKPPTIVRLRERHHALARLLASGMADGEAAIIAGYTVSRVSILRGDPAFQELLDFYRSQVSERYFDMHDKLADLGEAAVDEIARRVDEAPEEITTAGLLEIGKFAADRSGHGPSSTTQVDVRVGLAEKLEAARQRTLELRAGLAKDISP